MKKYKCKISSRWGCEADIEKVEIEKETEKSVWINGTRNAKRSGYVNYYNTWNEAKTALYNCQKYYVDRIKDRLEGAKRDLGNIKGMAS